MLKKTLHTYFSAKVIATLPIFIAVNIASVVIWILGVSPEAMPLILGMIATGLVDLDNRFIGRLQHIFVVFILFSLSTILVQLAIGYPLIFTLFLTLLTFFVTMFGAIGQRYNTIAFGVLLVAIYTVLTYSPHIAWYLNPLLILVGALLYSLSALCVFFIFPNRAVQESVGNVFLALSQYLQAKAQLFDPDCHDEIENDTLSLGIKNAHVVQAFNACQAVLFYRIQGRQRHLQIVKMMKYYFSAQEMFEQLSANFFHPQHFNQTYPHSDLLFRIQRILLLLSQQYQLLAKNLQHHLPFSYDIALGKQIKTLNETFEYFQQTYPHHPSCLQQIQSLLESLQRVDDQLRYLATESEPHKDVQYSHLQPVQIIGIKNIFHTIYQQATPKSPVFRHAIRLSTIVLTSCILVESLHLHLGYWILLTAILVCQPNHYATRLRLKQRILGSLLGVLIASLLPHMQPNLVLELGMIVITSSLFFFFRTNNYSYATFFITVQVLISFYVMGFDIAYAMVNRLMDTLLGGGIALLASFYLYPDWKYINLATLNQQAIKACAKYLLFIIGQMQLEQSHNPLPYRIARRLAQDKVSELGNAVNLMSTQPKKYTAHLNKGFTLAKLNYQLLGYISSLGAYRIYLKHINNSRDFSTCFYPVAKDIADLLNTMNNLPLSRFKQRVKNIQHRLIQNESNATKNKIEHFPHLLFYQLKCILEIIQTLYKIQE